MGLILELSPTLGLIFLAGLLFLLPLRNFFRWALGRTKASSSSLARSLGITISSCDSSLALLFDAFENNLFLVEGGIDQIDQTEISL